MRRPAAKCTHRHAAPHESTVSRPPTVLSILLCPREVLILLEYGAFIPDVPIVATVAARRFGLRAYQPRVHKLGKIVIGSAKVRQQLTVAVLLCVLCDGTADEMKAEALRAVIGVYLDPPAVHPFAVRLMLPLQLIESNIGLFKKPIRPPAPVSVDKPCDEFQLIHRAALYFKQCLAVKPQHTVFCRSRGCSSHRYSLRPRKSACRIRV